MGQKVHPHGLRVGVIKDWDAKWFANKRDFPDLLVEDVKIRDMIKKNYSTPVFPEFKLNELQTGLS